jgi:hypothetical protein
MGHLLVLMRVIRRRHRRRAGLCSRPFGVLSGLPCSGGRSAGAPRDAIDEVVRLKKETDGDLAVVGAGLAASLLDLIG